MERSTLVHIIQLNNAEGSGLMIENENLSWSEKEWLATMLSIDFENKEQLIRQINAASIIREHTRYFISIKFAVPLSISAIKMTERVPIEMRAYDSEKAPVQFLLHIINGYVSELEIFRADSSEISGNIKLNRVEVILSE